MSVLAEEEKTNKYLIAALKYVKNPYETPSPQKAVVNNTAHATPLIGYLKARLPATSVKLLSILHNN